MRALLGYTVSLERPRFNLQQNSSLARELFLHLSWILSVFGVTGFDFSLLSGQIGFFGFFFSLLGSSFSSFLLFHELFVFFSVVIFDSIYGFTVKLHGRQACALTTALAQVA